MNNILKTLLIAGLTFGANLAIADGATPPAEASSADIEVTDKQLNKFTKAQQKVSEVHREYSASLQEAKDPQEAQKLQAEAQGKMQGAVTSAGLSVDEYNQIAEQVHKNPDLQKKMAK